MEEGASSAKEPNRLLSQAKEPVSAEERSLPRPGLFAQDHRRQKQRSIKFEEKERVVMHDPNQSIQPFELQKDANTGGGSGAGAGAGDEDGEAKRPFLEEDEYTDDEVDYYYDEGKDTGRTYEQDGSHYNFLSQMTTRVNKNITNWQWYLRNKRTGGNVEHFEPGRLLDRDSPFHQSTGRMQISHIANGDARAQVLALYNDDWFHVLLGFSTHKLVLFLAVMVTAQYLIFAGLYVWVDAGGGACRLGIDTREGPMGFQAAFGFSVITASTIGYGFTGAAEPFFYDCPAFVVVVYFQVIASLIMNAFVVGVILQRVGRADTRSHQVVCSDKACIRCIGGHFYFSFQVYDLDRRHPVVEAHIRCYAVFHETDGKNTALFQTRFMRIQNPNDELGGVLFLSTPCTVVHCIDQWSPLIPPEESRTFWEKSNDNFVHNSSNRYVFPGLILREVDAECGSRTGASCPVCGESFETDQHLLRHIRYLQWEEERDGLGAEKSEMESNSTGAARQALKGIGFSEGVTRSNDDLSGYLTDDVDRGKKEMKDVHFHGTVNRLSNLRQVGRSRARSNKGDKVRGPGGRTLVRSKTSEFLSDLERKRNPSSGKVYLPRRKAKVNERLQNYADFSQPTGHRDIDISLLQTEYPLVTGKTNAEPASLKELFTPLNNGSSKDLKQKTRNVEDMRDSIRRHVESSKLEIIVLVEGIEARSSNTFQARHSYTYDNINFDKFFAPCMEVSAAGHAQVNLNHFHATIPVPTYVQEPAPVQSHS